MKKILIAFIMLAFTYSVFAQQAADTLNKVDKKGMKQGYWKKKDAKGILKYEGRFKNDLPTDTFKYYTPEGSIKAISIFSEKGKKSHTFSYYPNGNIMSVGNYINQKKDSLWRYYNLMGKLVKDEFYNTYLNHGEWHTYNENGLLIEKVTYKYGKKDGVWEQTFYSGFSSGKAIGHYKNDKLEGQFQIFNSDGKLQTSGNYKNNVRSGLWVSFSETGLPSKKVYYINDKVVRQEAVVFVNKKQQTISFDSIAYVYKLGGVVYLRKFNNTTLQLNENIFEMEKILGSDNFLRIAKDAFFANYTAIKGVSPFADKLLKVRLYPPTENDVISDQESTGILNNMFKK